MNERPTGEQAVDSLCTGDYVLGKVTFQPPAIESSLPHNPRMILRGAMTNHFSTALYTRYFSSFPIQE